MTKEEMDARMLKLGERYLQAVTDLVHLEYEQVEDLFVEFCEFYEAWLDKVDARCKGN